MLLKLLQIGEPVLRDRARLLVEEEILSGAIQELIDSMHETLRDAPGVGLAAPQIGSAIQLAIIEDSPQYWTELSAAEINARERTAVPFHVVINPKITDALGLRTQRIEPLIRTLDEFSRRADELKSRLDSQKKLKQPPPERLAWLKEFRAILRTTQETPTSMRNRE